jgi:ABC-2 type transport system permease protein
MFNTWLVAKHEFIRVVARRGFVLATLAIPLGLALIIGMTILAVSLSQNNYPIGYVDRAGILDLDRRSMLPDPDGRLVILSFPDEASARAALEAHEIQALFVFPPDYPANLTLDLYYLEEPPRSSLWREFDDFVRANLAAGLPDDVRGRLLEGNQVTVTDVTSNRTYGEEEAAGTILPLIVMFLFFFVSMASSGYLLQVVTEEKENRTMEVMVTSVTPEQLITGKAVGLLGSSLAQIIIYLGAGVLGVIVARPYVEFLEFLRFPLSYVVVFTLFFIASFALLAGIMIAIGAMVTEFQQGQQAAGLLNLLFVIPFFIIPVILEQADSPVALILTYFPTTSMLTVALRWTLGSIPVWQVASSWVLLAASAALMIWAASRIFRVGMLRYGQQLTLKSALAAVRLGTE